jgi:hypothetical protein
VATAVLSVDKEWSNTHSVYFTTKQKKKGIHQTGGLVGPGQFTLGIKAPERIE